MNGKNPTHSASPAPSDGILLPAIERLGLPVFLFGVIFLLATLALTIILTPDRFPVRLGDRVVRLTDLESEQRSLLSQKADLEAAPSPIAESRAPVLHQLKALRSTIAPTGVAMLLVENARRSFTTVLADPIVFSSFSVGGSGSHIRLSGDVTDDGGRSMQILASFVDGLRAIPVVDTVTEPEYSQRKNDEGHTVSPFIITLTLKRATH